MDILTGGFIIGLLALWKLIEKIVDAKLAKRNNNPGRNSNSGKTILCPYDNSVALKNSLNNIDTKLGTMLTKMTSIDESQKRVERKLNV